jgi:hypothetical protein
MLTADVLGRLAALKGVTLPGLLEGVPVEWMGQRQKA